MHKTLARIFHAKLTAKQWFWYHFQRNLTSKCTQTQSLDCHVWGNVRGLSQAPTKTDDNRKTGAAGDRL